MNMRDFYRIHVIEQSDKLYSGAETAMAVAALVSAGTAVYSATQKPKMPSMPKQPEQIVGVEAQQQAVKTLEEDQVQKASARQTARKGAQAYRIPLEAKSTGVTTGGGTGLNI